MFDIDNNVENLTEKIVNDLVQADDIICKDVDGSNMADMETTTSIERQNNVACLRGQLDSSISVNKMAAL